MKFSIYLNRCVFVMDKKIFKVLPIKIYVEKFDLSVKKVKVNRRLNFCSNFMRPMSLMLHTKPQSHWPFGSREDF